MSDHAASGATANRAPSLPDVLTSPAFCDEGLMLGAHTRLSSGDPLDDRIHALLTIAYGETLAPTAPEAIAKAAIHWRRGNLALANLRLAFCRLPKLDELAVLRLQLAEWCLEQGLTPAELLEELGHRRPPLEKYGYDPAELRDRRGRWRVGDEIDVAANTSNPFPDPIKETASRPLEQENELQPRHLFPPLDPFHLV